MTYSFSQAHRYLAFMTKSGEHSWQSFSLVCGIFLMAMCFGGCGGRAERPELVVEGPGGVTFVEPPLPVEENIVLPAPVEPEPTPVVEPTDYEEEDCPDEEPPEPITECDALAAESGCPAGEGCFPFLLPFYPSEIGEHPMEFIFIARNPLKNHSKGLTFLYRTVFERRLEDTCEESYGSFST